MMIDERKSADVIYMVAHIVL